MPTFTVKKIKTTKENVGKDGDGTVYKLRLVDAQGAITDGELYTNKHLPPAPAEGATIEATIEPPANPNWLPKITLPRPGGRGGGGFSRVKSPEERRSIAMQSSITRGVEVVRIAVDTGWKPEDVGEIVQVAVNAADRFYERVMKAEAGS